MKKSILNLGKALGKIEQKEINGGGSCSVRVATYDNNGKYLYSTYYSCKSYNASLAQQ
ncbi:hypothetical protein [Tenacibaculum sp. 190524A02b]|uniref:Uncharacterized protein n=1 Tax=Tenacibaculum vairaonense TaxID=3137860 RepID=A0ABP1FB58_9FLAO